NLSGYFEVATPGVVGTRLTTLARVRQLLELLPTNTAPDALLDVIISGVSERIQRRIGRRIVEASVAGEVHTGRGAGALVLLRRPVTTVTDVRIQGVSIASSSYKVDGHAGILHRVAASDAYAEAEWDDGFRNIAVDYTAGYAIVPEDLALAATLQAAYVYGKRGARVGERGQVIDVGGSSQYLTGPWAPGVLETIDTWREEKVA
ncbi:MAG: hypothetical protein L0221_05175, partial [Chloroflexi bacterium]|nr:hypothetical protein [Chloroflexota bacterium]